MEVHRTLTHAVIDIRMGFRGRAGMAITIYYLFEALDDRRISNLGGSHREGEAA